MEIEDLNMGIWENSAFTNSLFCVISTINTNSAAENLAVNLTLTVNCASGGDRRKIDNKLRIIAVKQPQSCFSVESNPCSAKGLSDRSHL